MPELNVRAHAIAFLGCLFVLICFVLFSLTIDVIVLFINFH